LVVSIKASNNPQLTLSIARPLFCSSQHVQLPRPASDTPAGRAAAEIDYLPWHPVDLFGARARAGHAFNPFIQVGGRAGSLTDIERGRDSQDDQE
jgi:hypothetical protein